MPMNAANEMAAQLKTNEHQSTGIALGRRDEFDKFDEQVRAAVQDFQCASDHWKSTEDMQNRLSLIDRRLDQETSERRAIYYRLVATEGEMKRRGSLRWTRYLIAICIGVVAGALAWQSYGEAGRKIIATRAPQLGWSPEAKQMIAGWVEQIGLTQPLPGHQNTDIRSSPRKTPAQTAPDAVTANASLQQTVEENLAAVRETLKELAARQDQMEHDITKLQAVDMEILAQNPSPVAQRPATPARNPTRIAPPTLRQP
ncbi:MAG: hypothetical protein WAK55_02420 [Xanthobacteraceae bacterium]